VRVLFVLISPTVRAHLHLLSRLSFALRDRGFKDTVLREASREDLVAALERCERRLGTVALPVP
jgi:PTS system nitrogen regulatory IIA component